MRKHMNTEIRTASRFEEADFDGEQSKPMVVGIDNPLVKSMAALHEYFDHRFEALENSVHSNHTQINVLIGIQFALAGLLVAALAAVLFGGR